MMAREGRFLEALGIEPGEAIAESVRVEFLSGHTAQVTWTGAKVVSLAELSRVFSQVDARDHQTLDDLPYLATEDIQGTITLDVTNVDRVYLDPPSVQP